MNEEKKEKPDNELGQREFFRKYNKLMKEEKWNKDKIKEFINKNEKRIFTRGNRYIGTHRDHIIIKKIEEYEGVKFIKEIKEIQEMIRGIGFIAGGRVRQEIGNSILGREKNISSDDVDIYCYREEDRKRLVETFIDKGYEMSFMNSNCVNFTKPMKVQIITSFYGDISTVIDEFDFTICRVGMDEEYFYMDKDFEENLKNNLLVIKTVQCPIGAIRRIIKYTKKGFFMTGFQMLKLYMDWDSRSNEYKEELVKYLMKMEKSEDGKLSQEEFEELESILIKVD